MKLLRKIRSDTSLNVDPENVLSNFHENIKSMVLMAQFFGIMPLYDVSKNVQDVKFKWRSLRMVYSLLNVAGAIVTAFFCIAKFVIAGLVIDKSAPLLFYTLNSLATVQFILIARKWSQILKEWYYVDNSMKNYTYQEDLKKHCVLLTAVVMGLGGVEHLLFIGNAIFWSIQCEQFTYQPAKTYFIVAYPHYFTLMEYSPWTATLAEISNFICTFAWNFTDLFIMLISVSLTFKYKQIVFRLKTNKTLQEKLSREIREDYQKVANLTRFVDSNVAGLVLVSFTHNTLFLCIQLYNSIKERTAVIESIYFFYSFGFLMFKIVTVTLYAAQVNETATKPLKYLFSVPTEFYTVEVSRFIKQINYSPNGINASGFFMITKNFLLQIAGTIVTVELMIFQFAPADRNAYKMSYDCVL